MSNNDLDKLFSNFFGSTDSIPSQEPKSEAVEEKETKTEKPQTVFELPIVEEDKKEEVVENVSEETIMEDKNEEISEVVTEIVSESEEEIKTEESDQENEITIEEVTPKKRKRRTKKEMEEARAAEEKAKEQESEVKTEEPVKDKENQEEKQENEAVVFESSNTKPVNYKHAKFNPDKLDMKMVVNKFLPDVNGDGWLETKAEIEDMVNKIKFTSEITSGAMRVIIPQIADVYSYIRPKKAEYEACLESLENLISRQKSANSVGSSVDERKKNGFESCEQFKLDGVRTPINLYDMEIIFRTRLNFIQGQLDILEMKKTCMINYISILKMENQ